MHRILTLLVAAAALLPLGSKAEDNFIVPDCYQGFTLAHSGVQGMDIWDDYLVSLQNYGTCNVYKINSINSATKLTTFRLASYDNASATYNHANVAAFSNQFYDSKDKLPLLYVTRCHSYYDDDGMRSVCYVERLDIDNSSSTLVQKICYDGMSYHVVLWTIDRQNNFLYAVSNTTGAGKMGNKHYVRKFKIPEVGEGKPTKVFLTDADALESYYLEDTYSGGMNAVTQGGAIHNGLLYMPCGYDTSNEPSILYVWDLEKRRMDKELNMTGIFAGEFEDCSVNYPGYLVLQCNSNHIYFMSLEEKAGDWADVIFYDGITYRITDRENKTAELVGYVKIGNTINIPSYVPDGNVFYKVTSIAENVFKECSALTTLTLPSTLTNIGKNAFWGCNSLTKIYSKILDPAKCTFSGFTNNIASSVTMYVPDNCRKAYRSAAGWKNVSTILERSVILNVGFSGGDIVLTRGESSNQVGKTGDAIVQDAPDGSYALGSSKVQTTDKNTASYNGNSVFYVKYDRDDNVGQALKDQFTIEALFRLDKIDGASYNSNDGVWNHANSIKILGSQGGGGFSLMHNSTAKTTDGNGDIKLNGLSTEYIYHHVYSSDPWGQYNHVYSQCYLHPGRFYHVAVSIDKGAHTETIYINGRPAVKATLAGVGDFVFPDCGTSRRSKGMFFILGGDATGENTPTKGDNPNATTFKYFKIHNIALNDAQVEALYNDEEITRFTEPEVKERLLDVQFDKNGGFADKSDYATIEKGPDAVITTQANTDQQRYEMVCDGNKSNFLTRPYHHDAAFTRGISDGYSIEFYAKVPSGERTGNISAISSQQAGGGPGFEISTDGKIVFNANAYGFSGYPNYNYSQGLANVKVSDQFTTDKYLHYVAVYAPNPDEFKENNAVSSIYLNGQLIGSRYLNGNEVTDLPFAGWQWFCIGGDTAPYINRNSCDYPWIGTISMARVWGKPLTADDVLTLYNQAAHPGAKVTLAKNGYAAVCYPFNIAIPDGVTAYVATSETEETVTLEAIATAGEAVPYGTPVILKGTPNTTIELTPTLPEATVAMPESNLLKGYFTTHDINENQIYTIPATDTEARVNLSSTMTLAANQAYLPNTGTENIPFKNFEIKQPDGIKSAVTTTEGHNPAVYYNLKGQRVEHPTRGIYIRNGSKVFVK
jgi:hypothetical protein